MKSVLSAILILIMLTGFVGGYAAEKSDSQNPVIGFPRPCSPDSWIKQGIVLEPNQPWEGEDIQNFTSPAEPLGDGRWRIWYGSGSPMSIAVAEGIPGGKMTKYQVALSKGNPASGAPFAIGNLLEEWRPTQPVHIKLKDGGHRLYFWAHSPKHHILRYLAADSSDGRHYRVIDPNRPCIYHFLNRAVEFVGTTPSGLTLTAKPESYRLKDELAASPELITNDATTVYQLPDGSFEMYTATMLSIKQGDPRWANNDCPGLIRVIDRLVSTEGLHWSGRQRVLQPDANDPIDLQFYYLCVTYTPQGRVGMLGHYRVKAQTQDLEWCFSPDGVNWIRPFRNRAWLERGWPGESDSYGIYAGASLVFDSGRWWLFYTGVNSSHNGKYSYGPPRSVIMLATTNSIFSAL
jgi:hypothetical protein